MPHDAHVQRSNWVPSVIASIAIIVSIGSLAVSFLSWRDSHRLALLQATPDVTFEIDTDTGNPPVGLKIFNPGPAIARIKGITYYVDKRPVGDIERAIDFENLYGVTYFEFDVHEALPAGETVWLISSGSKKANDNDANYLADVLNHHLAAEADVCSAITGKCHKVCSTAGWCNDVSN